MLAIYKGCLGCPTAVRPKQYAFVSNGKTKLPTQAPCAPQAATVIAACCVAFVMKCMLRGPTGSCTSFNSLGRDVRYAYRFTTVKLPKPHAFAKCIHRLTVGSSEAASAVLGFSIQKHTFGSVSSQTRRSRYRYCCAESVTALDMPCHRLVLIQINRKSCVGPALFTERGGQVFLAMQAAKTHVVVHVSKAYCTRYFTK